MHFFEKISPDKLAMGIKVLKNWMKISDSDSTLCQDTDSTDHILSSAESVGLGYLSLTNHLKNFYEMLCKPISGVFTSLALLSGTVLAAEAPKPNIIFILADDLGYADVSFNGQTMIQTPNLQTMRNQGINFTQYYCGGPQCAPSRGSLFTGMFTSHTSIHDFGYTYRPEDCTIGEILQGAGYQTLQVGKWGGDGSRGVNERSTLVDNDTLNPHMSYGLPYRQGYDGFLSFLDHSWAHFHYPQHLWRDDPILGITKEYLDGNFGVPYAPGAWPPNPTINRSRYAQDVFMERVLKVIQNANGDHPFYLQCDFIIPHRETLPPNHYNPYTSSGWPIVDQGYAAMISYLDLSVGQIMQAVDANPAISTNTMIIFTGDNGPQVTDGHNEEFFNSNGSLRGRKFQLWEGGIREPFCVRWPSRISAGATSNLMVHTCDILPTLAELVGVKPPSGISGISIVPTLLDTGQQPQHEYLYWVYNRFNPNSWLAIRKGDWKYHLNVDNSPSSPQLYNLATDLSETTNLATNPSYSSILSEFAAIRIAEGSGMLEVSPPILSLRGSARLTELPGITSPGTNPVSIETVGYYRFDRDGRVPGQTANLIKDEKVPGNPAYARTSYSYGNIPKTSVYACNVGAATIPLSGTANNLSLNFIGECTQYLYIPHHAGLSFGQEGFTLEAWVAVNKKNQGTPPFSAKRRWLFQKKTLNSADSSMEYGFLIHGGDLVNQNPQGKTSGQSGYELTLVFGTQTNINAIVSHFEVLDHQWHYLSASYDPTANQVRFVMDNRVETFNINDDDFAGQSNGPLVIGIHHNNQGTFNQTLDGRLDEIRISRGILPLSDLLNRPLDVLEPRTFILDFGTMTLGAPPVEENLEISNGAESYAVLMNGSISTSQITDRRLSIDGTAFMHLTDGATVPLKIQLNPSSAGDLIDQSLTLYGYYKDYDTPAVGAPITLKIQGSVQEQTMIPAWKAY